MPFRPGRQLELLEQDPRELLRRAELELLAGELERGRLELLDPLREPRRDLAHPVRVDPDPGVLHVREDGGERQLDLVVELLHPPLPQPRARSAGASRRAASARRTSAAVSSSVAGSGTSSSPYSRARSSIS